MMDVKHDFTDHEKIELGQRLTATMTTCEQVKEQKKTMSKEFDGKIKVFEQAINDLHGKLRDGHEFRPRPVIVHFNKGTKNGKAVDMKGSKRIVLKDSGEHVRDEPMSPGDFQAELIAVERAQTAKKKEEPPPPPPAPPANDKPLNAPEVPQSPGQAASTAATA